MIFNTKGFFNDYLTPGGFRRGPKDAALAGLGAVGYGVAEESILEDYVTDQVTALSAAVDRTTASISAGADRATGSVRALADAWRNVASASAAAAESQSRIEESGTRIRGQKMGLQPIVIVSDFRRPKHHTGW